MNINRIVFVLSLLISTSVQAQDFGIEAVTYRSQITKLMGASTCAKYPWKSRGTAPKGYIKGMGLSFARSLCRTKLAGKTNELAQLMSSADRNNSSKDALTHLKAKFSAAKIRTDIAGADALRALYTLGIGLGMRESSGMYCEGWDASAGSNRPSSAAEAGLFQTSYDSMAASPYLKQLYTEYQSDTRRCNLDVYKEGASCKTQKVLGSGAGAVYQAFNKSCPAFATEYAMTLLRVLRQHFGPINRREAEVIKSCETTLHSVQSLIESDVEAACTELF